MLRKVVLGAALVGLVAVLRVGTGPRPLLQDPVDVTGEYVHELGLCEGVLEAVERRPPVAA